jgi:hypothetical protein
MGSPDGVTFGPQASEIAPCMPIERDLALFGDDGMGIAVMVGENQKRDGSRHNFLVSSELVGQIIQTSPEVTSLFGPIPIAHWKPPVTFAPRSRAARRPVPPYSRAIHGLLARRPASTTLVPVFLMLLDRLVLERPTRTRMAVC